MSRGRKTVAVLCVALVVFAAVMPGGVPTIVWAPLVALWTIVPAVDVTTVVRSASRSVERTTALLSLRLLRAPPAASRLL